MDVSNMLGFLVGNSKNIIEAKVIIEFFMEKYIFRLNIYLLPMREVTNK